MNTLNPHARASFLLPGLIILLWMLLIPCLVLAATETIEVHFLPLQEAAEAARSQLSPEGRLAVLASRRLLIIEDDAAHIEKVRKLLAKIDQATPQFLATVRMQSVSSEQLRHLSARASLDVLNGGWAKVSLGSGKLRSSSMQNFQLRLTASREASIEAGHIRPLDRQTRIWLSGYGLVALDSVEMVPMTSGFTIRARPAGVDAVRVHLTPWIRREQARLSGSEEMLLDLGTVQAPAQPPGNQANLRLNAAPGLKQPATIEIHGASTEITIPLNREVTLAAVDNEARSFGRALLASRSSIGEQNFLIRLRIDRRP